ncbi:ANTAR domain-containing protein [Actinomycetospora sp. CA-101289]|uniref:ANTAR domain-containing protein n=1 Tax=Actinomycetospora sp. CA-101289 TaxID=3239893 RepID=UPI003D95D944
MHDELAASLRAASEQLVGKRSVRDLDATLTQIVATARRRPRGGRRRHLDGPSRHEDDELHQAEGMLAARLDTSVEEAVNAIQRRAEDAALTPAEIATEVIDEAARPAR